MSIAAEETRFRDLLDRVEKVEAVASTMDVDDERRETLIEVADGALRSAEPVRPAIAAMLLQLSERTVRTWVKEGLLVPVESTGRLLLDPVRIHDVLHVVRALRSEGHNRNLLDAVWYRLTDQALLDRPDLAESLAQMQRGEGEIVRPLPKSARSDPVISHSAKDKGRGTGNSTSRSAGH